MVTARTRWLLASATFLSGLLTGGIVDRALVAAPAWSALGPAAWAQFSLRADLGRGLVAYPVEAIGAALLVIAATVSFQIERPVRRSIGAPLYLAVAFSMTGLLITLKAAPIMLSLRTEPSVSAAVAFTEFNLWGLVLRGMADLLAFVCEIWALATLRGPMDLSQALHFGRSTQVSQNSL
jgi:hypothetical protein